MNTIQVQMNDTQYDAMMKAAAYYRNHSEFVAGAALLRVLESSKSYLWSSGCGKIELEIPAGVVVKIAQPGDNEPAIEDALDGPSYLKTQLENVDMGLMRTFLEEAGIEPPELDPNMLMEYVLWMACHDLRDNVIPHAHKYTLSE